MVSDIIAYPQRIVELLDKWCEGRWAEFMVVTMKFQGDIAWDDLELAVATVKRHGYSCRVKHFFNNKNEVTFMVEEIRDASLLSGDASLGDDLNVPFCIGKALYPPSLPSQTGS